ncbi:MAG: hypothetical protein MR418_12745 [Clostridiales bacterium]|nr:hypothetical protein [Clostridiales bacterium]MDY4200592.1 hypothetical protein [Candidatus Fimadaptatus sp.]
MKLSFISLWPLLLIWFGLSSGSSRRADGGSPMASGVLITYGIMFMLCEVLGWQLMQYIWPGFLLGPALGLYKSYRITGSRAQRSEARILLGIGGVLMLCMLFPLKYMIALLMIGGGIAIFISIFRRPR